MDNRRIGFLEGDEEGAILPSAQLYREYPLDPNPQIES